VSGSIHDCRGEITHQPDVAATVDQSDPATGHFVSQRDRRFAMSILFAALAAAVDTDSLRGCAHANLHGVNIEKPGDESRVIDARHPVVLQIAMQS
jgi:hypothetical protein